MKNSYTAEVCRGFTFLGTQAIIIEFIYISIQVSAGPRCLSRLTDNKKTEDEK